jgi:hypothetical protein
MWLSYRMRRLSDRTVTRVIALIFSIVAPLVLLSAVNCSPAGAASLCINGSEQIVPCYDLPAGAGSGTPARVPATPTRVRTKPAIDSVPRPSDLLNGPGAEAATGAVVFGVVVGTTSLVFGLKRRQRRPRWNDRSDYRSA